MREQEDNHPRTGNPPAGALPTLVSGPDEKPAPGEICLVAVVRNEADIAPAFLKHYRALGVDRFFIIDNDSDDGTRDLFTGHPDVSLFHTRESYRENLCGLNWANDVADHYCAGHWTVMVDADEFLVLPAGRAGLRDQVAVMEENLDFGLYCPIIDFFPEDLAAPGRTRWHGLEELVADAPLFMPFDPDYLRNVKNFPFLEIYLDRGVRAAIDCEGYELRLSKVPLVFWRPGFRYFRSTHESAPVALSREVGALAHFKFRPGFARRFRARLESDDRQNASALTAYMDESRLREPDAEKLRGARRYEGPRSLAEAGWVTPADAGPTPATLPALWDPSPTRRQAFRALARDARLWRLADDLEEVRRARLFLERLTRLKSVRATYPLRRWLARHRLLSPNHLPEHVKGRRPAAEVLAHFYESVWWDIVTPLRFFHDLARGIRWRELARLLRFSRRR